MPDHASPIMSYRWLRALLGAALLVGVAPAFAQASADEAPKALALALLPRVREPLPDLTSLGLPPAAVLAVRRMEARRGPLRAALQTLRALDRPSDAAAPGVPTTQRLDPVARPEYEARVARAREQLRQARRAALAAIAQATRAASAELFHGELLYEEAEDEHAAAVERYQRDRAAYARCEGSQCAAPVEPRLRLDAALAAWLRGAELEPSGRRQAYLRYLAAYAAEAQGDPARALAGYRDALAGAGEGLAEELHLRIGDIHFEDPRGHDRAVEAYQRAAASTVGPVRALALYKLGWCHYRKRAFATALETFARLLDHFDRHPAGPAEASTSDLRAEAIRYVALGLADTRWGGLRRAEKLLRNLGSRPWEVDVWQDIGEVYFVDARYANAAIAFRRALALNPPPATASRIRERLELAEARGGRR